MLVQGQVENSVSRQEADLVPPLHLVPPLFLSPLLIFQSLVAVPTLSAAGTLLTASSRLAFCVTTPLTCGNLVAAKMVAAFPLGKLIYLGIRQLSKPIAVQLRNSATRHPFVSRYICAPPAQSKHNSVVLISGPQSPIISQCMKLLQCCTDSSCLSR